MRRGPGSLSSTAGLLGVQRTRSLSLAPGSLLLKEGDPQTAVHLVLGEGWVVGSLPSGLCWHKWRFLGRLGGGQEPKGRHLRTYPGRAASGWLGSRTRGDGLVQPSFSGWKTEARKRRGSPRARSTGANTGLLPDAHSRTRVTPFLTSPMAPGKKAL